MSNGENRRVDEYQMRKQPDPGETDPMLLVCHVHDLVEELELAAGGSAAPELHAFISILNEKLADAYLALAGAPAGKHTTQCAINQAPAYRPAACDCGAAAARSSRH